MKDITLFYYNRYLKRDTVLLGVFSLAVIFISAVFHTQYHSIYSLGELRHKLVQFWVIWNVLYTFLTAFSGYRRIDASYETLLLPFSINTKFIFTSIRVLIIMPIVSSAIMIALDACLCEVMNVHSNIKLNAPSVWKILIHSGYIMHRLPIMPFYLLLFSTITMALKTIKKERILIYIPTALLFCIAIIMFGPHSDFNEYNYPFISGCVTEYYQNSTGGIPFKSTISEIVSWTMMGVRAQRVVTYLYLLLLPISFLYLSYLRFKEIEA